MRMGHVAPVGPVPSLAVPGQAFSASGDPSTVKRATLLQVTRFFS